MVQISNLLFPNPGKSNRKSEEQLFLQRGQVTNMTCADLSQDLREPFATAVRAHSKSAFEIRLLTRKRWVFERRSYVQKGHTYHACHRFLKKRRMRRPVCVPPWTKGLSPPLSPFYTGRGVWPSCPTTRNEAVDKKGKQGLIIPVYLHLQLLTKLFHSRFDSWSFA